MQFVCKFARAPSRPWPRALNHQMLQDPSCLKDERMIIVMRTTSYKAASLTLAVLCFAFMGRGLQRFLVNI
jgi:hypothetical protein